MSYYDNAYHDYGFAEVLEECGVVVKKVEAERLIYCCPFCGDKKGKGDASLTKNVYHCYKCNADGFLFEMYAKLNDIPVREAKRFFENKYDLKNGSDNPSKAPKIVKFTPKPLNIAPDEKLNEVYSAYLDMLTLSNVHRQNLIKRGLTDDFILKHGYKSVPILRSAYYPRHLEKLGYNLDGVTGFYRSEETNDYLVKKYGSGFYIPTRNIKGEIVSMQVRNDYSNLRYYTFSSSKEYGGADMSSQMHFVGVDTTKPINGLGLTEGALKADVASCLSGKPFVSIPGVGNFKALKQGLQSMRDCGEVFKNTTIYIMTDMDENENNAVKQNVAKIQDILSEFGFHHKKINWDCTYKGIDDLLLATKK